MKEIADMLSVSQRTIQKLINAGELKAVKIGNIWRVKDEDFQEYLSEHSNKA